jgi:hypothetical protein
MVWRRSMETAEAGGEENLPCRGSRVRALGEILPLLIARYGLSAEACAEQDEEAMTVIGPVPLAGVLHGSGE